MSAQEQFIFNFLEGNLSKSEHQLCEELMTEDQDFREKVNAWKLSYYHKNQSVPYFENKQDLMPKSKRGYWIVFSVGMVFSFIAYQFYIQKESNDLMQKQINELELKMIDTSSNRSTDKVIDKTETEKEFDFMEFSSAKNIDPKKKKSSIDNSIVVPVDNKNEVDHVKDDFVETMIPHEEVERSDANATNEVLQDENKQLKQTKNNENVIVDHVNEATDKSTKQENSKSKKERKRLKDWFKEQQVVPMN